MIAVTDQTRLDDWLAARRPEQLAAVLTNRGEMRWGGPLRGIEDLALGLSQPLSVNVAVLQLPLPGIQLLHALAALGPKPTLGKAGSLLARGNRSAESQLMAIRSALTILAD